MRLLNIITSVLVCAVIIISAALIRGLYQGERVYSARESERSANLAFNNLKKKQQLPRVIESAKPPFGSYPSWHDEARSKVPSEQVDKKATSHRRATFTYTVQSDGAAIDVATFSKMIAQTLSDSRGWSRLGVSFQEVPSGGQFNLIIANASRLPVYSAGCSSEWSCRVGDSVIINEDRWMGASASWSGAGGSLRDYQHMVVNHEVGHWLGHGHQACPSHGSRAPIMQQQSMDMQGCLTNPWPLHEELWSSRL